jgi:hypothetical protein
MSSVCWSGRTIDSLDPIGLHERERLDQSAAMRHSLMRPADTRRGSRHLCAERFVIE